MNAEPLTHWEPENPDFWARQGARIARRNLWISVLALMLSFAVWMVWSVVVVNLPHVGFRFSTNQLFWLAALPALCGATLRIFYAFMVPMFGGRVWTTLSTCVAADPGVRHRLCGAGPADPLSDVCPGAGVAVRASAAATSPHRMANISFFFPVGAEGRARWR